MTDMLNKIDAVLGIDKSPFFLLEAKGKTPEEKLKNLIQELEKEDFEIEPGKTPHTLAKIIKDLSNEKKISKKRLNELLTKATILMAKRTESDDEIALSQLRNLGKLLKKVKELTLDRETQKDFNDVYREFQRKFEIRTQQEKEKKEKEKEKAAKTDPEGEEGDPDLIDDTPVRLADEEPVEDEFKTPEWMKLQYDMDDIKGDDGEDVPVLPTLPERPKRRPGRHQYEPSAENISVVKKSGDAALIRVRGWSRKEEPRQAVYKYLTVDSDELENATGNPDLEEDNIWRYVWKNYEANPKDFKQRFVANIDRAFNRFQQMTGSSAPSNLKDYINNYVGETHKDLLINAFRRSNYARRVPGLLDVFAGLSNEQAAQLLEQYPKIHNTKISREEVQELFHKLKRRRSPFESRIPAELDHLLTEAGLGSKLMQAVTGRDPEVKPYVKKLRVALIYDRLIDDMTRDLLENGGKVTIPRLQEVGVDVSKYPIFRQLAKTNEQQALGEPEFKEAEPEEAEPEEKPQPVTGKDVLARREKRKEQEKEEWKQKQREKPKSSKQLARAQRKSEREAQRKARNEARTLLHLKNDRVYNLVKRAANNDPRSVDQNQLAQIRDLLKSDQEEIGDIWAALKPETKHWISNAIKQVSRQQRLRSFQKPKKSGLLSRFKKALGRESYARAIQDNDLIEEARLTANDSAFAALKLYTEHCNRLQRRSISQMSDRESQYLFENLLKESKLAFRSYKSLIEEHQIPLEFDSLEDLNLLEELISLVCQTANPLMEEGAQQIFSDKKMMAESYQKVHIKAVESQGSFVPLSNII